MAPYYTIPGLQRAEVFLWHKSLLATGPWSISACRSFRPSWVSISHGSLWETILGSWSQYSMTGEWGNFTVLPPQTPRIPRPQR